MQNLDFDVEWKLSPEMISRTFELAVFKKEHTDL